MGDAMGLQKNRTPRRVLSLLDSIGLDDADEHPLEVANRILLTIPAFFVVVSICCLFRFGHDESFSLQN
jgi:hypothetical protein